MNMNHWLITYDLPDDRRRARIAALLETLGDRVQYSVFEVRLTSREEQELDNALHKLLDPDEDSVRWYPLYRDALPNIREYGCGQEPFPKLPRYQIL